MSELKGIVNTKAKLNGTINTSVKQRGIVSVGGTLIGAEMARRGLKGEKGDTGDTGVGISSIAKTGTAGKVDTYTITYTNGNTATFTVTNGNDGNTPVITASKVGKTTTISADGTAIAYILDGDDGNSPVITTSKVGKTTTILADGTSIGTVLDGDDGNSPVITTTKTGGTTTIYADGVSIGTVDDGDKGDEPIITASKTGKVTTVYVDGTSIATINDGDDGNTPVITASKTGTTTTIYADGVAIATIEDGTTAHDVPSGGTSGQVLAKQSNTDYDLEWVNQAGGGAKNVWYGTCSTSASSSPKTVTTTSGDFTLTTGNILCVLFAHANALSGATLEVDGNTAKAAYPMDGVSDISNRWGSNELVMFAYDGSKFILLDQSLASTTAYGITKLNNTVTSTSTSEAATAKAVKTAYENCGVTDVTLDGSSVVSSGVAALTSPTIPTKTSDLVNDSLFAKGHIACFHGTCSTAAGTAEKAVTCTDFKSSDLVAGACIVVEFDNDNSAAIADLCLNVNSTGAYNIKYNNAGTMANIDKASHLKAAAYMFYFNGTYWVMSGFDVNTDTVGYTIRHNGASLPTKTAMYRYRIMFTSADGNYFVPANSSSSTSASSSKTVTTEKIDPFAPIYYYASSTAVTAGNRPTVSNVTQQYNSITLGYSFNRTGAALTLTSWQPVYIKCAPQTDGSAKIDADNPFVQTLPSTADGKIYILLGYATAATTIEMVLEHPVYYFKDGAIREWVNVPANLSNYTNDVGYLTSYTETDPVFSASTAAGITSTDVSNWNNGKLSLDTTAATGTTDGDLYAAIVALEWDSDVIE